MSPPFTSSTRSRYTSEHISLVLIRGHPLHSNYQVSGSDHVRNNLQTTLNQSSVQALGSHSTNIADNITQPARNGLRVGHHTDVARIPLYSQRQRLDHCVQLDNVNVSFVVMRS
eukprot:scpid90938/ scgid3261/ 